MARTRLPLDLTRVRELAQEGHTEREIARQLGISQDTLTRRKQDSADFADAIKAGQEAAHSVVANTLYRQAKRGNVTAIIWYEKTRRGFKDQVATEQDGTLRIVIEYEDAPPAPVAPGANANQAGSAAL